MRKRAVSTSGHPLVAFASLVALAAMGGLACAGRPVPLVARAGTTVGLAIGGEGFAASSAWLAYGTSVVPDRQRGFLVFELRQGSTVVATLPTRLVTKLQPDSASEAGLTGSAPTNSGSPYPFLQQAMALVDIPSNVPPGTYRIYVRRSTAASGGSFVTPDPLDSTLYSLEVIGPQNDVDFTPFDHEEGILGVFAASPAQLQSVVPKPKLLLNLPQDSVGFPAAASLELAFDPSRIDPWGGILNSPTRPGVLITLELSAPNRVRLHYVNPAADGAQLALVFEVVDRGIAYDPVSETAHFFLLSQQYYDADGNPMSVGSFNPIVGIR